MITGTRFNDPLGLACALGNIDVVKKLLDLGANIEKLDSTHKDTPFLSACFRGRMEVVEELIKRGANVHALSRRKNSALNYASAEGHAQVVDLLVNKGLDVNARNSEGLAPLHSAVRGNHMDIVVKLIESGADINMMTEMKELDLYNFSADFLNYEPGHLFTPLSMAMRHKNRAIASELIKRGADVEARDPGDDPILMSAVFLKDLKLIKELIEAGAKFNFEETVGNNKFHILHMAAAASSAEVLQYILDNGGAAHLEDKTLGGDTALQCAINFEQQECVDLLSKLSM